jgi:hypothetical protein
LIVRSHLLGTTNQRNGDMEDRNRLQLHFTQSANHTRKIFLGWIDQPVTAARNESGRLLPLSSTPLCWQTPSHQPGPKQRIQDAKSATANSNALVGEKKCFVQHGYLTTSVTWSCQFAAAQVAQILAVADRLCLTCSWPRTALRIRRRRGGEICFSCCPQNIFDASEGVRSSNGREALCRSSDPVRCSAGAAGTTATLPAFCPGALSTPCPCGWSAVICSRVRVFMAALFFFDDGDRDEQAAQNVFD